MLQRRLRNPAVAALRALHLFRGPWSYRSWLDTVTVAGDGWRDPRPLDWPESPTSRCRDAVADLATRRGDVAFFAAVAAAAEAFGVSIPPLPEEVAALAQLVMSPWSPVTISGLWPIDVVRLAGPPDTATLTFVGDECAADLYDMQGIPGYEQAAYSDVTSALRRPRKRRGRRRRAGLQQGLQPQIN